MLNSNWQVSLAILGHSYKNVDAMASNLPKVLFYDVSSPFEYSKFSLEEQAIRGTEGTLIRIAHALGDTYEITIAQHRRNKANNQIIDGVHYVDIDTANSLTPDVVILLRDYHALAEVGERFPTARHFFWMHNMAPRQLYAERWQLRKYQYEIITVSHFHCQAIHKKLRGKWYQRVLDWHAKSIPLHALYNPIPDDLHPDHTPINENQLLFMSAPYKGLPEILTMFSTLRQHFPAYELLIANPSDQILPSSLPENVKLLGSLSRPALLHYLRSSFCVFYPQAKRVETFGLVYAEANAVGTPVIAHDFGAAREVLSDPCQLIDGNSFDSILSKMNEWRKQRPIVRAKEAFRLKNIIRAWSELLVK